jgi:hypothetical protein
VVSSKANDVSFSPGKVADSLGWKQVSFWAAQADDRQRFCVYASCGGPGPPRCFQISFFSFLHYIFAFLAKREKQ